MEFERRRVFFHDKDCDVKRHINLTLDGKLLYVATHNSKSDLVLIKEGHTENVIWISIDIYSAESMQFIRQHVRLKLTHPIYPRIKFSKCCKYLLVSTWYSVMIYNTENNNVETVYSEPYKVNMDTIVDSILGVGEKYYAFTTYSYIDDTVCIIIRHTGNDYNKQLDLKEACFIKQIIASSNGDIVYISTNKGLIKWNPYINRSVTYDKVDCICRFSSDDRYTVIAQKGENGLHIDVCPANNPKNVLFKFDYQMGKWATENDIQFCKQHANIYLISIFDTLFYINLYTCTMIDTTELNGGNPENIILHGSTLYTLYYESICKNVPIL